MKNLKLATETIQPLTEGTVATEKAMQILDGQGNQKEDSQPSMLRDNHIQPLTSVGVKIGHALISSSIP